MLGLEALASDPGDAPKTETPSKPKATAPPAAPPPDTSEETETTEAESVAKTDEKPPVSIGDDLDSIRAKRPKDASKETPKALREAYETTKKELATHQAKVKELEAAVAKAAEEGRTSAEAAFQKKLEAAEKERDRLDAEMRYVRFEQSTEFKEKYQKPLQQAYALAEKDLAGVKITTGEGQERDATLDDIVRLLQLPAGEARRHAQTMFGEDAQIAIQHRGRILERIEQMNTAREEWRTKGAERAGELQEQQTRAQKAFNDRINQRARELAESAPDYFGDSKDDPEESALVQKASDIVDVALGRRAFKEGTPPEEQAAARADAIATVAERARHFGKMVLRINRLEQKLEEATAKLKSYETSEPTPTPTTTAKPAGKRSADDDLEAIAIEQY